MSPRIADHALKGKSPPYLNYTWELLQLKEKRKDLYQTEVEGMTFPKGSSKIAKVVWYSGLQVKTLSMRKFVELDSKD